MKTWPTARFDQIFKRIERKFVLDDSAAYKCVGVRWYGLGAFVREHLLGAEISRKQQWLIRSGDIVYNKLFAWKGAFAIADHSIDGCIVSDKFPTYRADEEQVDDRWLRYYFQTPGPAQQAAALSKGAAAISKLTLNPPQFWELTVPLPPIPEQRRILKRIEALEMETNKARMFRTQGATEVKAIVKAALYKLTLDVKVDGTLSDVLTGAPRNGWSAACDNADDGIPVLSLAAVTGFHYRPAEFKRTSLYASKNGHFWLQSGDILITRSNTPELVGHAAIYDGRPNPCIYPDLMMRLDIQPTDVDRRFVWYWLQSRTVRDFIERNAKGTSPTMKKISQGTVMAIPFPSSLPIENQRHIVAKLDALQSQVNALEKLQAQTAAELDALLPSILDSAFIKGEL
jgi:type I restriction enzyme, S subunit